MALAGTFAGNHLKKFIKRKGFYMPVAQANVEAEEGSVVEAPRMQEGTSSEESSLEASSDEAED